MWRLPRLPRNTRESAPPSGRMSPAPVPPRPHHLHPRRLQPLPQPPPTQLPVSLGRPQLMGSGSIRATVEVCLADAAGAPALSPDSLQVILKPAGQMSKSVVPIAANSPCTETVSWTSTQPGPGQITAEGIGLLSSIEG